MEEFIGCDAHKKYSVFVVVDERGRVGRPVRVGHTDRKQFRGYLQSLPAGSPIAVEPPAIGTGCQRRRPMP